MTSFPRGKSEALRRGTRSSNLSPSSEESAANPESQAVPIFGGPQVKRRRVPAPGPDRPHVIASNDRAAARKSKQSKLRVQPEDTPRGTGRLYGGNSCTRKSAGHYAGSSPLPVTLGQ